MTTEKKTETTTGQITIPPPNIKRVTFRIKGTAPYMQHRFSQKAMQTMIDKQKAGSQGKKGKLKEPRDFDADYKAAMHISEKGWHGIPAPAFRGALISACRLVGFKMTLAKLSLFIEADGLDEVDGTPLVKIEGTPEKNIGPVRNETGVCDIRVRPMWRQWNATVKIRFDADQFKVDDVANLLQRAGEQVGIGEGRPDSKMSYGMDYGTFTLEKSNE